MPKPRRLESEADFVARYLASPEARGRFPDQQQRLAVARSVWGRRTRRKQRRIKQMTVTLEQLLKSIGGRACGLYGAGNAAALVRAIHDQSPRGELLSLATDERWVKELQEAAERLTWSDEGQEIFEKSLNDGSGIASGSVLEYDAVLSSRRRDRDGDILEPKGIAVDPKMPLLWQHLQLQPIGKHVAVLSQDDDRLVCKFAIADTALGRDAATLVRFGALRKSHGFKPVPGEFSPVEIVKGQDGKPLRDQNGNVVVKGWHIKQAQTFEGSLVSIPSNADGNVLAVYEKQFDGLATAFSRGELKTELVKCWAKSLYEKRPTSVPGVGLMTKSANTSASGESSWKCSDCGTSNVVSGVPAGMDLAVVKCSICGTPKSGEKQQDSAGLQTKAGRSISAANEAKLRAALDSLKAILSDAGLDETPADKLESGISDSLDVVLGKSFRDLGQKSLALATKSQWDDDNDLLPGSYEFLADKLQQQATKYLLAQGTIDSTDGYVRTMATFPSQAIVCYRQWGATPSCRCFRLDYTVDQDGQPKFSGTPQEVEIKPQIIEKAWGVLRGRDFGPTPPDSLTILSRKFAGQLVTAGGLGGEAGQAIDTIQKAIATVRQMVEFSSLEQALSN